jgi:hypothetical protein
MCPSSRATQQEKSRCSRSGFVGSNRRGVAAAVAEALEDLADLGVVGAELVQDLEDGRDVPNVKTRPSGPIVISLIVVSSWRSSPSGLSSLIESR